MAMTALPYILIFTGLFLVGISVIHYRRRAASRRRIQARVDAPSNRVPGKDS